MAQAAAMNARERRWVVGANVLLTTLLAVTAVGLLIWAARTYHRQKDLTSSGLNSLNDRSVQLVKSLDQKVTMTGLYTLIAKDVRKNAEKHWNLVKDQLDLYETVGGGQGACPDSDGPSGVHVAMSNTFNTPAEALELSYPLRVERYELRLGSGGAGRFRGGDGVVRELRALEPCRLSLLSQRRMLSPRGEDGGEDGLPGRNLLNGAELPAFVSVDVEAGDLLRIETPGGGGWGGGPSSPNPQRRGGRR